MRWVKRIALTLVAIVVLLLGIGLILPSTFKVQRSIDIAAARQIDLIATREWKKWSVGSRDPRREELLAALSRIWYASPPRDNGQVGRPGLRSRP